MAAKAETSVTERKDRMVTCTSSGKSMKLMASSSSPPGRAVAMVAARCGRRSSGEGRRLEVGSERVGSGRVPIFGLSEPVSLSNSFIYLFTPLKYMIHIYLNKRENYDLMPLLTIQFDA